MRDRVDRFISDNKLLNKGESVIVALSGGADSVCLLHILISLKEKYRSNLYAAHFNHGIRGDEADRDEEFVAHMCDELMIPLYRERADVPAAAAETGESVELCGRRLRYRFFDELASYLGGAKIATAHQRSDNVETVLWNLTRGAGVDGLSGIPAARDNIIRPLLCCSRAEIESYCAENHLDHVTDSTNLNDAYTRNKLRHRVVPVLRELNPAAEENIARTAVLMSEADAYLKNISLSELKKAETTYGYSCERLLKLDPAVLKYAVKTLLEREKAPVDHRHIDLIIDAMRLGGAVQPGKGFSVVCAQGTLRIVRDSESGGEQPYSLAEFLRRFGTVVHIRGGRPEYDKDSPFIPEKASKINNLLLKHGIPCDIITSDTVLRRRKAGDTFTDPRRGVTKTLKKLMNELKIPRELRDEIPVIAKGSVILWMKGVGTSAQALPDLTRDGDIILLMGDK